MTFIQPLELQTWLVSVFAGNPEIFTAVALLVMVSMAAMFRMNGIAMFFILAMFLLMFAKTLNSVLLYLMMIIGGIAIGYWIYRIFTLR